MEPRAGLRRAHHHDHLPLSPPRPLPAPRPSSGTPPPRCSCCPSAPARWASTSPRRTTSSSSSPASTPRWRSRRVRARPAPSAPRAPRFRACGCPRPAAVSFGAGPFAERRLTVPSSAPPPARAGHRARMADGPAAPRGREEVLRQRWGGGRCRGGWEGFASRWGGGAGGRVLRQRWGWAGRRRRTSHDWMWRPGRVAGSGVQRRADSTSDPAAPGCGPVNKSNDDL